MQIRRLTDDDIESAVALEVTCYTGNDKLPNRWNHWFITIDQEITYGAFDKEQMVGLIYAADKNPSPKRAPNNDPAYRIEEFIVHPQHQNKRIGSALLTKILNSIDKRQPKQPITLYVEKGSDAIRLYERFGFHASNDQAGYSFDNTKYISMTCEQPKDDTPYHAPAQG